MKNSLIKFVSVFLCVALLAGGIGVCVYAADSDKPAAEPEPSASAARESGREDKAVKDETVYVLAGADGSVQKIIVSDWIKNTLRSDRLTDRSELVDPENVKGSESYVMDEEDMRVWDARGNDIYCQGSLEKELPVELSVSYTLDGAPISPEELGGKSGRLTIRFDYRNRQYEMKTIGGKEEKIYVPFVMLTGVLLDGDLARDVEVTNGKLINDGDRIAVVGVAFPGLQENLGLDRGKLELPSYVEITADVEDFELTNTVTIATNEPFSRLELDALTLPDGLDGSVSALSEAMDQLTGGSSQLYDGLCTLLEKSGELVEGIDALSDGAYRLKEGAGALNTGAGQVSAGAGELATGLNALAANNATLQAGARQMFNALLSTANGELQKQGLDVPALTAENYGQVLDGVLASLSEEGIKARLEAAGAAAGESGQGDPQQALAAALEQARAGREALTALKTQLDSCGAFCAGLDQYTAGVASAGAGAEELSAGAARLADGAAALSDGAGQLSQGLLALQKGAPALVDGVAQLRDGAMRLSGGLAELDEKGIQKLLDALDGDLGTLVERLRATGEVSRGYESFSGLAAEMDGQVKFLYRTDAIQPPEA